MAWRIQEQVVRGVIDNRTRGRVTGRIWFAGRAAPIELSLAGNAWRDLAGRRLEFVNPEPKAGSLESLAAQQDGVIGDCTASRKVKVPDIPLDQISEYDDARKPFPWHWGNSLYLEWHSRENGRVVIESTDFQLTIGPDITWEMSESEEEKQRRENARALTEFMENLIEASEDASEPWEPPASSPTTEAEAERMQADSDRLMDRIQARLNREGPDADYDKILEEELERRDRERGRPPPAPEEVARSAEWIEEMNRATDEVLKNPDPELEAERAIKHPLAKRSFKLSLRLVRQTEQRGWVPDHASAEHPVAELRDRVLRASVKFAGALNGEPWPPAVDFCAHTIVRLKRARGYLDDALAAADACAEEHLVDAAWLSEVRQEVESYAQECDMLIDELRTRLNRGSD